MKKFIEEILNNQTFLDILYNFGRFYKGSDYEKNMSDFYNSTDKKVSFISKNTEWLFITDDGDLEDGNREFRLRKNWQHFSEGLPKVNNIKAIDILSNTRSTMLCDARYGKTYLEPIVNMMNPYFQQSENTQPEIKAMFKNMTELSLKIVEIQSKYGIHKIEKELAKQEKNQRNKAKAQI